MQLGETPERGWLVGISQKEQDRLGVPKDRSWLILQTETCRDCDSTRTVLAAYLTDMLFVDGRSKPERCGDVALRQGVVKKDSWLRLSELRAIRETEINEIRGPLPPIEMMMVDKVLRDLLFYWKEDAVADTAVADSVQESEPAPKPEPFKGKSLEPIKVLPNRPRKKPRKKT